MMMIIIGAVGPVFTTAIMTSVKILITVDNAKKCYSSHVSRNILFAV